MSLRHCNRYSTNESNDANVDIATGSKMDDEKLILLVSKYEELYNLRSTQFSNFLHKEKCWQEIAADMIAPVQCVKKRWSSLRHSYRRAIRVLRASECSIAARKRKKWRYFDQMSFLDRFITDDESLSNMEDVSHYTDQVENIYTDTEDSEAAVPEAASFPDPHHPTCTSGSSAPVMSFRTDDRSNGIKTERDAVSHVVWNYPDYKRESSPNLLLENDDPITHFFISIAQTVKRFPPSLQASIKGKVFQIVNSAEMSYYTQQEKQPP